MVCASSDPTSLKDYLKKYTSNDVRDKKCITVKYRDIMDKIIVCVLLVNIGYIYIVQETMLGYVTSPMWDRIYLIY